MRRRTLDALLTTGGLVVAAVLLIAGGLLTYGHSFVHNEVKTQLAAQQIFFPAAGSAGLADPADQALPHQVRRQAAADGRRGQGLR